MEQIINVEPENIEQEVIVTQEPLKIMSNNYEELSNKPKINNVTLSGNQTSNDLGLQSKLEAGENIIIEGNVISADSTTDYEELQNKPLINGNELSGDSSAADLGLQGTLEAGDNIIIEGNVISADSTTDYEELQNKPSINNVELTSSMSAADLGIQNTLIPGSGISITNDVIDVTLDLSDYVTSSTLTNTLSSYYTKQQVDTELNNKQNVLTAGDNISISNNTISATDTTYSAGSNVSINANNEISATDTTYTAGSNVTIDASNNNEINVDLSSRVAVSQGVGNSGKILGINSSGNVTPINFDYKNLLNKPRPLYIPPTQNATVDFLDLANGTVYDCGADFTIARYNESTVVASIPVHTGDIFVVSPFDSTEGYSNITLLCVNNMYHIRTNMSDWADNGILPNSKDLYDSLVIKPLPYDNVLSGYECDISTLADGLYVSTVPVVLTGWVSGTYSIGRNAQVTKISGVVIIENTLYIDYDLSTATKRYVESGDIVQTTGQNTDKVVSQKAWTDSFGLEVL